MPTPRSFAVLTLFALAVGMGTSSLPNSQARGDDRISCMNATTTCWAPCQRCDEDEGCLLNDDFCYFAGFSEGSRCFADKEIIYSHNHVSFCRRCDVAVSTDSPSNTVPAGTPCNNNEFCDGEDTCEDDVDHPGFTKCVASGIDPCVENGVCNNTCNLSFQRCEAQPGVMSNCTGEDGQCSSSSCFSGVCEVQTYHYPCDTCGCESGSYCNTTSLSCAKGDDPSKKGKKSKPLSPWIIGLIGGVGGGVAVLVVLYSRYLVRVSRDKAARNKAYMNVDAASDFMEG